VAFFEYSRDLGRNRPDRPPPEPTADGARTIARRHRAPWRAAEAREGTAEMTGHPRIAATMTAAAMMLLTVSAASPAAAHGTLTRPVSRTAACGTEGKSTGTAACKAALAASGRDSMPDWDNLRVANVDGRDREVIPDGKLCSAGLAEFRGLDLARRDWPATTLKAGARFRFGYRATIPHQGTFRLYVTRDGYDPREPLAWSDLEAKPFLTVPDPKVVDGAYVLPGRLPADKRGRHVIYAVWQNTDTPDTYYSCSDVVFRGAAASSGGAAAKPTPAATADEAADAPAGATPEESASAVDAAATSALSTTEADDGGSPIAPAVFGLLAIGVAAGVILAARRRNHER
jgi:chitin-binding protein